MKKICFIKCNKYTKLKNPKISYIFDETVVLSIICDKSGSKDGIIFREENSIEILKIPDLIKEDFQMNI